MASFIAGPSAAVILSDFGADVIKVEPPTGELWRIANKIPPQPVAKDAYPWHLANRNKRGMTLDLKSPSAQQVLEKLVKWADVLIVNTPHPARERLKLEYDDVVQWNPRLIYADITGFGDKGPDADLPGFDITSYWARSGLLSMTRDAGAPPTWPVAGSGDNATAVGLYSAIVTALYRRERTGKGSYVTTSLLAEGVWSASVSIQAALCDAKFFGLHDRKNPANAAMNVYRATDDTWFVLIVTPDKLAAVAKAIGRPDLLTDPRFSDPAKLMANMPQLTAILDEVFCAAADGALVRGLQRRSRHLRRGAWTARGDQRSAAAGERHRRSARRRRRQADVDDQQPDSGAWRRQGAGEARPGAWRTQRGGSPGSSASARPKSTACVRAAPFRKQRNMRRSVHVGATRAARRFDLQQHAREGQESTMDEIVTERSGSILRVQLNRPAKKNAMTSSHVRDSRGYLQRGGQGRADTRVVLWHGAGDSFCAGNDIEDFLKNPPGPGESPQAGLMKALIDFDKPLVAAVQGAAIGGGTTMLTHCDFVYAGESAKFQMPFINLAVRAGVRIELLVPATDRAPPRGGTDLAGAAVRRQARRGAWDSLPRSCPTRICWRRRPKRRGNWQQSRPARCKPASGS